MAYGAHRKFKLASIAQSKRMACVLAR